MAHKLLMRASQRGGSLVCYHGNFQCLRTLVRSFASQNGRSRSFDELEGAPPKSSDDVRPLTVEPPMGLFGPMDTRLPLPGNLGLDANLQYRLMRASRRSVLTSEAPKLPADVTLVSKTDVLTGMTNHDRQVDVVKQFLERTEQELGEVEEAAERRAAVETTPVLFELECSGRNCSKKMKKEFAPLFPQRDLRQDNLTVITLSQRTINDMSAWSEAMDNEREELNLHFIDLATEICLQLKEAGYWADFVDPSSSMPYFGAHTNDTLSETDDRMQYLGMDIQDMGCCKVVFHPQWKANVFVGCLFTNAPLEDPLIQELLTKPQDSS